MAGGIDWFRWHHGSVSDQKFGLVAHKAGASVAEVIAVWACLLEAASSADERGSIGSVDFEAMDFALGMADGRSEAVFKALEARGLIDGSSVASWDRRQPKREDGTAADRKRRQRDREHELQLADAVTSNVTKGVSRNVTHGHDRGEERRVEERGIQPFVSEVLKTSARKGAHAVLKTDSGPGSGSGSGLAMAEGAAKAMAAVGLVGVSAANPKLRALVDAGMTLPELVAAAQAAVGQGKSFAWALARAENQRRDAAAMGALPAGGAAVDPDSRQAVEADGERLGIGPWDQGSEHWPAYRARVRKSQAAERGGVAA